MKRFPVALWIALGCLLLLAAAVVQTTSSAVALLLAAAAGLLLIAGAISSYHSERSLRLLTAAVGELLAAQQRLAGAAAAGAAEPQALLQRAVSGEEQAALQVCAILREQLAATLTELEQMTAEWEKIFDAVEDGIVVLDRERRILRINLSASRMLERTAEELIGNFCCGAIHRDGCTPEDCAALQMLDSGRGMRGELSQRGDDDILEVFTAPLTDSHGVTFGTVHLLRDLSRQLEADRKARLLLQVDALTGLPSRNQFRSNLQQAAQAAFREQTPLAVFLIDLDGFSEINDGLGHAVGDRLLAAAANRLQATLPASAGLGRLAGDEFAAFLPVAGAGATAAAEGLLTAFAAPFQLAETPPFYCTVSIGIAFFGDQARDASQLLKHADIAMYHAKQNGRNTFRFFSSKMDNQSLERLRLGTNLRHALERNEFELHYQPRIDLVSKRVTGMEALLRWNNGEFGEVPPARFIPLAEDNGLILPIGQWVLRSACRQVRIWRDQGLQPPRVAVNLSALQLKSDDIVESVTTILAETGFSADLLELELTETVLMADPETSARKLQALRDLGIHLALDDFGTGYSSLSYLKTFPIDHIKIDRSFVRDICINPDDASIVEVIISIAHNLGMKVIAEGVETAAQLDYLFDHGCDEAQGYYYSRPLNAAALEAHLRQLQADAAIPSAAVPFSS